MYYNGDLNYNGHYSSEYGLIITEVPQMTHSEIQGNTYDIPNRDGLLYDANTKRSMASIKVRFALKNKEYRYQLRQIRNWLSGRGRLTIDDAPDSFYEVKRINLSESQLIVTLGYIEAEFIIEPYEYIIPLDKYVGSTVQGIIINNEEYSKCYPLYKIEPVYAEADDLTLYFMNHKTINNPYSVSIHRDANQTIYIDTKRKISYDQNGNILPISVDYEKLTMDSDKYLMQVRKGSSIMGNGFYVKSRGGYII